MRIQSAQLDLQLMDLLPSICSEINPERVYGNNELLLFILPNDSRKSHADCKSILTGIIGECQYVLCNAAELSKWLNEGHLFYSTFCTRKNLLYSNKQSHIPLPISERLNAVAANAGNIFNSGYKKAQDFLSAAAFFIGIQNFPLAAFMLQQSMELSIRSALIALGNPEVKTHSLTELNRHLKRFGLLQSSFISVRNDRDRFILERLDTAYISARYTSSYRISCNDLMHLYSQVSTFLLNLKQAIETMLLEYRTGTSI